MKKKALSGIGAAATIAAVLALITPMPAYALDFSWGAKNCTSSSTYVYTKGTGTGNITHSHRPYGSSTSSTYVANHGAIYTTTAKTFWFGYTSIASVAGAGASTASIYCG